MSRPPGGRVRLPEMESQESGPVARMELKSFLEILTLTGFIVAQPVLDVFGKSPETFVFRGAGRTEVVLFAVLVTVIPAGVLWIAGASVGRFGPRVRRASQTGIIWLLLALLGIQIVKKFTPVIGVYLGLIGAFIGVALTLAVLRFDVVRRWLRFAWPATLAFILIFLLITPVSALVLPQRSSPVTPPQAARPVTVVMVVFDQLPLASLINSEGEIAGERFPNFARLAQGSTWYRNYTVNQSVTRYSMPTILSGAAVTDRSKHPTTADFPNNLFTLLRDSHEMNVYELVTKLCPLDPCHRITDSSDPGTALGSSLDLLGEAVGIWLDVSWVGKVTRDTGGQFEEELEGRDPAAVTTDRHERDFTPEERAQHIRRHRRPYHLSKLLNSMRADAAPALHFIHIFVPHYPWRYFASGVEYLRPEVDDFGRVPGVRPVTWTTERWPAELYRLRHVLQAQFADRLLGDLIFRLRDLGQYDQTLLIVTSDHGHSFQPGRPGAASRKANMHEILWVPLLIKAPNQQEGLVDDRLFHSTDLLPTIADYQEMSIPWPVDGMSMLSADSDRGPIKFDGGHSISVSEAWERLLGEAVAVRRRSSTPMDHPVPIGPRADLLGRPVSQFRLGTPAESLVSLDLPEAFADAIDPVNGPLPALVSGVVQPPGPNDSLVVVAFNGRVAGVSPIFAREGGGGFIALAPESFFRTGKNSLELFLLEHGVLRPLRATNEP